MRNACRYGVYGLGLYTAWLGMMAVHESGHVLHAWLSGGEVTRVALPLTGFSRTDLSVNPHPLFTAWGGPIWGCVIPLCGWGIARFRRLPFWHGIQWFAGFCLIANGAYLGAGSLIGAGDAGDLMRYGSPQWLLITTGLFTVPAGLGMWNGLSIHFGLNASSRTAQ